MKLQVVALSALALSTAAQAQDCKSITDPAKRLACFDQAKDGAATKKPAAAKQTGPIDDGWQLKVSKDGFSDKVHCVISPVGRPWVQINVGNLYVSYQGRGGVAGYQVRVDENPATPMTLPTPTDKSVGLVHLKGDAFFDAMSGERLRIETFTILRELKNEDLKLAGAKRLYKKMGPECERSS